MNIIEAVKTGKAFRRPSYSSVYSYLFSEPGMKYDFSMRDILANDWEIESQSITITENQFDTAIRRWLDQNKGKGTPCFFGDFKAELGFK